MLTTHRGIAAWARVFDPVLAVTMLDRLLTWAAVLINEGEGFRMRAHRERKAQVR